MFHLDQKPNFAFAAKVGLDIPAMMAHHRKLLCNELDLADTQASEGIMRTAVIDLGGTLMEAKSGTRAAGQTDNWGPNEFEIDLMHCSGRGTTMREAIYNWTKASRRMADAFGKPEAAS